MISESSFFPTIIHLVINFCVFIFLVLGAFQSKISLKTWRHWLSLSAYVVTSTVFIMIFLLKSSPLHKYTMFFLLIWTAFTVVMAHYILHSHLQQVMFLVFVVFGMLYNTIQISQILYDIDIFPNIFNSNGLYFLHISCLVLLVFSPALWYLFLVQFKKVINMDVEKSVWKYLFIIPASAYTLCILTSFNYNASPGANKFTILLNVLFLNMLSYLSFTAVLRMLIKTQESLAATKKATIIERELLIQNEQFKKLTFSIKQTNRMHHDMRHHFLALKGFIDERNFDSANTYIETFIGEHLQSEKTPVCENHSVDMILRHYLALAQTAGAKTKVVTQVPSQLSISDASLCSIFGNLIENAVEACQNQTSGKKFISIYSKLLSKNMFAITVANSFCGDVTKKGDSFMSTKHSGTGVGTESVKSVVTQNGGECRYNYHDGVFKVSVLLLL